ncbi:MAG: rhomboid family intramembrane serine protease [Paraglaciecola sp.]|uniref:rhomboid family intramembrane serine protease n=1 Tax=Paraglaciecola sp. TaxID=1920173 RepID=UPI00329712CE
MKSNYKPIFTIAIVSITVIVSLFVAYQISGSLFGKSRVIYLADYGGLTVESLKKLELWRLVVSQLIHVHQKHMIYNALSIVFLCSIIERKIGFWYVLFIWLFAGGIGTVFSTQFGTTPWNTGSGASQAALGFAGFGLFLFLFKFKRDYLLLCAVIFSILPAMYLDIKTTGYPKPGHSLSFAFGILMAAYFFFQQFKRSQSIEKS